MLNTHIAVHLGLVTLQKHPSTKKRGRPPTITRDKIAGTAYALTQNGKDVTMQNVAAKLNVDVATLYRHLGSQQELNRLLAEKSAPTPDLLPRVGRKSLSTWLTELGNFYWIMLRDRHDLVEYAQSSMDPELRCFEHITSVLIKYGMNPRAAAYSYHFMINSIVGFVYQQKRDEEEQAQGRGLLVQYQRAMSSLGPENTKHIERANLTEADFDADVAFNVFLGFTVEGICAQLE